MAAQPPRLAACGRSEFGALLALPARVVDHRRPCSLVEAVRAWWVARPCHVHWANDSFDKKIFNKNIATKPHTPQPTKRKDQPRRDTNRRAEYYRLLFITISPRRAQSAARVGTGGILARPLGGSFVEARAVAPVQRCQLGQQSRRLGRAWRCMHVWAYRGAAAYVEKRQREGGGGGGGEVSR